MQRTSHQFDDLTHSILIEDGLLARSGAVLVSVLPKESPAQVLVSDSTVMALYGASLSDSFKRARMEANKFEFPPGDGSKNLATAAALFRFLVDYKITRDAVVIALGGGVVSDLAGFVAATWMRGIRWIACPTTLEAQIDAAIGGKTALNIPGGKNLIGAFHPPMLVLIDPQTLRTLPDRDYRAGLAESVKHAAIFSPEFFEWHETHADAILRRDPAVVLELIRRNVKIKCDVVQKDPYERIDERILLNFGHTIGHALEEASRYELRHGESVALGMIAAARISQELGRLPAVQVNRLCQLISKLGLPTHWASPITAEEIFEIVKRDKKVHAGRIRWVLLSDFGEPIVSESVSTTMMIGACDQLLSAGDAPR